MGYVSIACWRDLDDGHLYQQGDPFPHDGRDISEKRIADLISTQNKAGFALIKAVEEPKEEIPQETKEVAKKATRSRKKA